MSSARTLVLVLAVFAATPAAADPVTWSKTTMAAAPTYFPAGATAMVVGVGDTAQPVVAALLGSLQASDSFELVTDARSLGKVDELGDDEIVKRAFARPIKRVAIVRVFPAGASTKAVVTVYAAQGQVTTAFTLVPGKPLAENPNPKEAAGGVARDEMQSVVNTTNGPGSGASGRDGEITYQRQQVGVLTGYGVFAMENVTFFKNGHLISDTPGLYDALDMHSEAVDFRDKLANHEKWGKRGAWMTALGGTGLITFGLWALLDGANYNVATGKGNDETIPWALTAGSAAVMVAGIYFWVAHPAPNNLSADEAVSLVDAHNSKKRTQTTQLRLVPSASPSNAGLLLTGSF